MTYVVYRTCVHCMCILVCMWICSGYKHSTPIDEKAPVPLSARGAYNHCNGPSTPGIRHTPLPYNHQPDSTPRQSAQARILAHTKCSGYKHSTPIDEKAPVPLSARGAYNHSNGPYQTIWCAYFSFIHSLTPGVGGPGSSGSPGGSDSLGYLSPDHPHPGSAPKTVCTWMHDSISHTLTVLP